VKLNCPVCQRKIPWRYRFFRSSNAVGLRKSFPCPHCGNRLIWSKWPYRVMWFGLCWMIIAVLIAYLTKSVVIEIATWVGMGVTLVGAIQGKFEVVVH